MSGIYRATLTFWPASPVPVLAVRALRGLGVELPHTQHDDPRIALSKTPDGTLVAQITFSELERGMRDLEPVLLALWAADINYVTVTRGGASSLAVACTFESGDAIDHEFYVHPDGYRLLSPSDLRAFTHITSGPGVLEALRDWFELPYPKNTRPVTAREVRIAVEPGEPAPTNPVRGSLWRRRLRRNRDH
jgi:hypothetical protein